MKAFRIRDRCPGVSAGARRKKAISLSTGVGGTRVEVNCGKEDCDSEKACSTAEVVVAGA